MCGFNPICYVAEFFAPFWTFIVWGFWIAVALAALWVLNVLKNVGGWPAVVGALVAAAAAGGYVLGRGSVKVKPTRGGKPQQLTRDQLAAVQRALADRGLYPGDIDGMFGAVSQAGMRLFQRQRNEPQTGFPTYDQLVALGVNVPIQ